jgi:hypothetical protein
MRFVSVGLGLAATLLVAAFLVAGAGDSVSAKEGDTVTVTMGAGRDASQTGTATLTDQGSQTQVVLNIQPGAAGVEQPVHIHSGNCPGVGAVAFPLTNVVNGTSTTVVDATLDSLRTGGYSINVHQDGTQAGLGVYVSCGAIPAAAQATPTVAGAQTTPAPAASPAAAPAAGGPPASSDGSFGWWYLLIAVGALTLVSGGVLALKFRSVQ